MEKRGVRVLTLLLSVSLLGLAALLKGPVQSRKPPVHTEIVTIEGGPPLSVKILSAFLGSFRTLLVDFLWLRAQKLQDRGEYFAAAELARWLTALQSKVDAGWSFQAWNLGVNIASVLPEEKRWPYVQAALELLWRDALAANPGGLGLYYDICWMWAFKIGGNLDSAAPRYRAEVRRRVREILGDPPYRFREFVEAEELLDELRVQPEVKELKSLLGDLGLKSEEKNWIALLDRLKKDFGEEGAGILRRIEEDPVLKLYDRALRARAFLRAFGLTISDLEQVYERYGDIGVDSPESFVVFWASRGLRAVKPGAVRYDALSLWRMRFRGLRRLFLRGRAHLAEKIDRDYREVIELVAGDKYHGPQAELFERDRRQFLATAVTVLFLEGRRAEAEGLFKTLRDVDQTIPPDLTCDQYVFQALLTELVPEKASRPELEAVLRALVGSALRASLRGDEEQAASYLAFARDLNEALRATFDPETVPPLEAVIRRVRSSMSKSAGTGAKSALGTAQRRG